MTYMPCIKFSTIIVHQHLPYELVLPDWIVVNRSGSRQIQRNGMLQKSFKRSTEDFTVTLSLESDSGHFPNAGNALSAIVVPSLSCRILRYIPSTAGGFLHRLAHNQMIMISAGIRTVCSIALP